MPIATAVGAGAYYGTRAITKKGPKPPPVRPTPPIQTELPEEAGEAERMRLRRMRGRAATELTPGFLTPVSTMRPRLKERLG